MIARALTQEDFCLQGYLYPGRFFNSKPRPLRLINSPPPVTTFHDVLYTPTTSWNEPYDGCLYDARLRRIDASCLWKETSDEPMSTAPPHFPGSVDDLEVYERPLLYLGYISRHYGHFLLESVARWWPLVDQAPDADRFLIHIPNSRALDTAFFRFCLERAGIEPQQIVYFDKPVRLKEVIVPDPSFQLRSHIYSAYRRFWENLLAPVDAGAANSSDQPLYVSRTRLVRGVSKYLGEEKIEAYLENRGARMVYPEQLPFAEQVKLFNEHKKIIGIIGSGMHNIVLSPAPKRVLYLTPQGINKNYFLIDRCFDADSTYLYATRLDDTLRRLWRRALARAKMGSSAMPSALAYIHQLDYQRVINWIEKSGYLA